MATDTANLSDELQAFAEPLIASGEYASTTDVLHAAMEALRHEQDERAYDEACVRAAEEGEASGLAEGDIFEQVRAELRAKAGTPA